MKTYIVIVNYNNWSDTIICLQDIRFKTWNNFEVIVVDNGSSDDSLVRINNYLKNEENDFIKTYFPLWKKVINTGNKFEPKIHLIEEPTNRGFAYGNNVGIRYAFSLTDRPFHIWLLNNDTVTHEESLPNLISFFQSDNYGLIGSKLMNYDPPHCLQALYGTFNKYTGRISSVKNTSSKLTIAYPEGASLFTSSKIIEAVGYLDENYFMYHEEIDLATRVKKHGRKIGLCINSIVYHKQGASTKSRNHKKKTNFFIESFKYKGLILFYRKHYPNLIYAAYLRLCLKTLKFLFKGEYNHSLLIIKTLSTALLSKNKYST